MKSNKIVPASTKNNIDEILSDIAEPLDFSCEDKNLRRLLESGEDLRSRWQLLLQEMRVFVGAVANLDREDDGRYMFSADFWFNLRGDISHLKSLYDWKSSESKIKPHSANILYYEQVWSIAKTCCGVVNFGSWVYWWTAIEKMNDKSKTQLLKQSKENDRISKGPKRSKKKVIVDLITEHGRKWVKISTMNQKRLLFEMAEQGWQNDTDSECGINTPNTADDSAQYESLFLFRTAVELLDAAKQNLCHNSRPKIRLVLPRLQEGEIMEIDQLISQIRELGVQVDCSNQIGAPPAINDALSLMTTTLPQKPLTDTLNIDCSILLALISDISHYKVSDQPRFTPDLRNQIEEETRTPLLPNIIYPGLVGRNLICTSEAAQQMREIVQIVGTDSEKARAWLILQMPTFKPPTDSNKLLQERFSQLSIHSVPDSLKLPIKIITEGEWDKSDFMFRKLLDQRLSRVTHPVTKSVFMFGWVSKFSTVSANITGWKTISRVITTMVQENELPEGTQGPHVWLLKSAHNLLATSKEKAPGIQSVNK